MIQSLQKEGVSIVFGYPGATIAPFYDKLPESGIRHILTRTEQGAGHAANGYARMSGKPGVCIATSGPGATNLMTAIATAYSDSIPMIAITGQVATHQLGRDVFQEVDTTGAVQPFTKYSYLLKSADDISCVFKEAFHIASTGRRGPVLIDVPVDVQLQMTKFKYPDSVNIRGYKPNVTGHVLQVRKVAEAVAASKRPLLCLGGGVFLSDATEQVHVFCERFHIPAVSTMMGVGIFESSHPLYCGMLGQSGFKTANAAVSESDLLVIIGARAGDRAITQPAHLENGAAVIHIDVDPAEIGKNIGTTIPLVGDAKTVLLQLMESDIIKESGDWSVWAKRLEGMCENERREIQSKQAGAGFVEPNALVRSLCAQLPQNSIYVADVGQNQIWSAKNFSGNGRFLTTGGMGTMGYSMPAAIGAKLACPDKTVVAVCGDGAFQMSMNELAAMKQHDVDVKVIIMRNGVLGMVNEIQKHTYGGRSSSVDLSGSPDLSLIAAAYGMEYRLAQSTQEADEAIAAMLKSDKPALLECAVDKEEVTA